MLFEELGRVLYEGPYVYDELAAQPGDEVWSVEIERLRASHRQGGAGADGRHGQAESASGGETLATVDESLGARPDREERRRGGGGATRRSSRRRLLAALALEAVGIGSKVTELAIAYVSEREQFGKKIGSYQAVSHSVVDAYVAVELARSLAYWAAWCVAEGDEQADLAVAAAKSQATEAAVPACEKSIQAHGGIGFTWEHPLHRYYKRALVARRRARLRPRAPRGDRRSRSGRVEPRVANRPGAVLVTGASTGIGEATARRLAAAGWTVHASVRQAGQAPSGTQRARLRRHRRGGRGGRGRRVGELDALVDNAGIAVAAPLEFLPPEELARQLDVNVVGQLRVVQAFLPALRRARGASC